MIADARRAAQTEKQVHTHMHTYTQTHSLCHTPRQVFAASCGSGCQALAAGPVAVQRKICDAAVLAPPPTEKPLSHCVVMAAVVLPVRLAPLRTPAPNDTGAQVTAAMQ